MKKIFFCIIPILVIWACTKQEVETKDLLEDVIIKPNAAKTMILADGTSIITVEAVLNNKLDKRKVIFETDLGYLIDSKEGTELTVDAKMRNDSLIATAKLRAPAVVDTINLKVQVDLPDQKEKYPVKKQLMTGVSKPTSIVLKANSFLVYSNYESEVLLTGTLFNELGNGVTNGYEVRLYANGQLMDAQLREKKLKSSGSLVSAIYSPGQSIADGQTVRIYGEVLDADKKKVLATSNTIEIFVTKKPL